MSKLYFLLLIFISVVLFNPAVSANNGKDKDKDKKSVDEKAKILRESADNNENEGEDEDEDEENATDSISSIHSFAAALSDLIWDINDSLMNIPAYDIYCDWNTGDIHPYKYDLTKKKDTTFLFLQDENLCGYSHPVSGDITSNFGPRSGRYHYGIDIKLQTGDSVFNAFSGVVRIAQISRSYGNVVVVRHKNGLETLYAHLSKINVSVGNSVDAGDLLGLGGNTGRSTGSHLHFEVRFKGEPINPNEIIDFQACLLKTDVLPLNKTHFNYLLEARAIKYHTIRKGDTLGAIAKRHGTTVSKLCKLNKMKSTTSLKIGRKIRYS